MDLDLGRNKYKGHSFVESNIGSPVLHDGRVVAAVTSILGKKGQPITHEKYAAVLGHTDDLDLASIAEKCPAALSEKSDRAIRFLIVGGIFTAGLTIALWIALRFRSPTHHTPVVNLAYRLAPSNRKYLIDRNVQINEISSGLKALIPPRSKSMKPIYYLPCAREDCPEWIIRRLEIAEGPEIFYRHGEESKWRSLQIDWVARCRIMNQV